MLGSLLHQSNNLDNNLIINTPNPPPKPNYTHHTRSIPFQMGFPIFHSIFTQKILQNNFVLITLQRLVVSYLLRPDTEMGEFAVNSKARAVFHGYERGLVEAQVPEDDHVGTGTECCGALVEEGRRCGAVV